MRLAGERTSQEIGAISTVLLASGLLLSACGSGEENIDPPDTYVAPIETVTTLCVDISGFEKFTDESCGRLANNVKAGFLQVSELTDNVIEPPGRFVHRIVPGTLQIANAAQTRCTNLTSASEEETARVTRITDMATDKALKSGGIDPNESIVVGVNSPIATCGTTPGKWQEWLAPPTDRCIPPPPDQVGYYAARAMIDIVNLPVIFTYTGENTTLGDTVKKRDMAHERLHIGQKKTRLAHEFGLCDNKGDRLPTVVGPEHVAEIRSNIRKEDASIMSYSRNYDDGSTYISTPQLLYLDVINQDQVIVPRKSGVYVIDDFRMHSAPALLRLDLDSGAIKDIIRRELPGYISPDDYKLWIGKIPPSPNAFDPALPSVGIYAAPAPEKSNGAPVFLLSILGPRDQSGNQWGLKDGTHISLAVGDRGTAEIDVQLASK